MKKAVATILLTFGVLAASAQQTIKSENVEAFRAVSLSGNMAVELIPASSNAVDIVLIDSEIKKFQWEVKDGTLSIVLRPSVSRNAKADVKIYYCDTLSNISVSGVELTNREPIVANTLRMSVAGGSKATVSLDVMDLELEVTGNSIGQFSGSAKYVQLRATEKSRVDTRGTDCVSAEVDAATGAEVYVCASERLVANAKTISTIFYRGRPAVFRDKSSKFNVGMGSNVLNIGD